MKKVTILCFALSLLLITTSSLCKGQANTSLSNLTSPTSINVSLLPKNNSVNLGSSAKSWKRLYFIDGLYKDTTRIFTADSTNTVAGFNVLTISTGKFNTAIGSQALRSNSSGVLNTAIGAASLLYNTTGSGNTATGTDAMYSNTTGNFNTSSGYFALALNKTGAFNVANGDYASYSNTAGYSNVGIGSHALYANTNINNLVAIGDSALFKNTSGVENTALGSKTLFTNVDGASNTAVGYMALNNNTASGNTASGARALQNNINGSNNVAVGYASLFELSGGLDNTGVGNNVLDGLMFGSYNSAFGYNAGMLYDGNYNTFIGTFSGATANQLLNATALGYLSVATANNQVRIGNASVSSIGGYANWTKISDGRFKKNIKENVPGLDFINKLKPVTYNLDVTGLRKFLGEDVITDKTSGKKIVTANDEKTKESIQKKEAEIETGFIAQEVEKSANELGYKFNGVDKPENEKTPYGLRYSEFVVPLVKAVQELSKKNDALEKEVNELKSLIKSQTQNNAVSNQIKSSATYLVQNQPNPAAQSTTIKYFIPEQTSNAVIKITNEKGQAIKSINLSQKNSGQVTFQTNNLASGSYFYSLITDGKTGDTKKMIIAH